MTAHESAGPAVRGVPRLDLPGEPVAEAAPVTPAAAPPAAPAGAGRLRAAAGTQWARQGGLLVALLLATVVFPKDVPLGIYGLGVASGAALALQAVGIVLVYRANRFLNFAQVALGAFGAFTFQLSVTYRPALRWFGFLCGEQCGSTAVTVNYWVSFALGLLLPVALAGLVHLVVIRRFASAPRLMLTVATLFASYAIWSFEGLLTDAMATDEQLQDNQLWSESRYVLPFRWSMRFGGAVFGPSELLTVVAAVTVVAALFVYLRRSRVGVSIRAVSESPDRAATLGIDVHGVTGRVWLISGGLSAIASMLVAVSPSGEIAVGGSLRHQVVLLTAAAIASFTSLPLTLAASIVLGAVQQATMWSFANVKPFTAITLLVLVTTFVLQRARASRGEIELASSFATAREIRPVPRELAGVPAIRNWRRALVVTGVLLFAGSPLLLSPAQVDSLTTAMLLALVAVSVLVLTGWAGQISFGQMGFAGIGAYAAACSRLPFPAALAVGVLAGAAVAVVVGFPALRLRGLHLAVSSLAAAVVISELLLDPEYGGRALPDDLDRPGIVGLDVEDARVYYYLVLVAAVVVLVALSQLRRSRTARALLAARDNELAAQSLGINVVRARLAAFAVSGGVASFAGVLLAYQQHAVQSGTFRAETGALLFQAAVLGGLGHLSGPILGTAVNLLPSMFTLPQFVALLLSGLGAMILVLLVPGGIAQALFNGRDNVLRRIARREGITVPSLQGPGDDEAGQVAPLLPRSESVGASVYVPTRYRLVEQWALKVPAGEAERAGAER